MSKGTEPQLNFSVQPLEDGYTLCANDKSMLTPGKLPFLLPSKPLADAICWEWQSTTRFSPSKMPLTSLAYTAIDRIAGQENKIIEALLVFLDTDTITYRDDGENKLLAERQKARWNPILEWVASETGCEVQVTTGIMPRDQEPELHQAFEAKMKALNVMQLSALSVLASCCSSIILALAMVKGHIDAQQAFELSRLEEDTQAETWGEDAEAKERAEKLKNEIVAAGRFLRLLERQ